MKKRVAALLMAAVFCFSTLNLSAASAGQPMEQNAEAAEQEESETTEIMEETSEEQTNDSQAAEQEETLAEEELNAAEEAEENEASSEAVETEKETVAEETSETKEAVNDEESAAEEEKPAEVNDAEPEGESAVTDVFDTEEISSDIETSEGETVSSLENMLESENMMILLEEEESEGQTFEAGSAFAEMTINGRDKVEYEDQRAFITALTEADNSTISIKLLQDVEVEGVVPVAEGQTVNFDLNGHKLSTTTKSDDSSRHYYAIDNYGTLTIEDTSEDGSGQIYARGVENLGNGVMTINGGKIVSCDANGGACVWNEADLTINGGTFETVYVGTPSDNVGVGCVNNSGKALITGGNFQDVNRRTYAIISTGELEITPAEGSEVVVHGAHGGLAVDSGTAVVNGGTYSSDDYYGLYVSNDGKGTDPMTAAVTVNGGTFSGKTYSVWIGSDYNDPVNSTIEITGGTFEKPLYAQAVTRDGAISVSGGSFSDPLDEKYCAEGYKFTATPGEDGKYTIASKYVAQIGTTKYETIAGALDAAGTEKATIQLLADVEEDVVIETGKDITIDLNGHTLTNVKSHTIYNEGTLTLTDSTGKGTVDNVTHAKAAVYNAKGATITSITDCTLTRSKEQSDTPRNSWYVLYNQGTIGELNATITNTSSFSSLICNVGSAPGVEPSYTAKIEKITGGTYSNRANVIKNDDNSYIGTISGGTFVIEQNGDGQSDYSTNNVVLNYGRIDTISGGSFTNEKPADMYAYGIICKSWKSDTGSIGDIQNGVTVSASYAALATGIDEESGWEAETPKINISGGTFTSDSGYVIAVGATGGNITVTGGTFAGTVYASDNGNLSVQNADLSGVSSLNVNKDTVLTYNYWGDNAAPTDLPTEPSLQTVPSAKKVNAPEAGSVTTDKTGSLTPAEGSPELQYRLQGTESWSDVGDGVTGLASGTYEIRYKPTVQFPETAYTYLILETSVPDKATLTVTFETNGGTAVSSVFVKEGTVLKLSDYTTSRDGYTFEGWYLDKDLKNEVTEITVTEDTTVFAKWAEVPTEPDTPTEPEVPTEPDTPTKPEEPTEPTEPEVPEEPVEGDATASIKVTMKLVDSSNKGITSGKSFYVAVFTDKDCQNMYGKVVKLKFEDSSTAKTVISVEVPEDGSKTTYYVAETDKDGNPVQSGENFGYQITIKGGNVKVAKGETASVTITNKKLAAPSDDDDDDDGKGSGSSHHSSGSSSASPASPAQTVRSAATGDSTNLWLPILLLLLACAGIGGYAMWRRRKKIRG